MRTFIIDSFTDQPFKGNPAGVCIVEKSLTDETMLHIAQELASCEPYRAAKWGLRPASSWAELISKSKILVSWLYSALRICPIPRAASRAGGASAGCVR